MGTFAMHAHIDKRQEDTQKTKVSLEYLKEKTHKIL